MSAQPKILISEEEYLKIEDKAPFKSEYFKGEVFAMAGASPVHNKIVMNLSVAIGSFLKDKKCSIYPSDLRIFVKKYPFYTYPDLSIICGEPDLHVEDRNTVTNPKVIIEVVSPSNANYDKGTKFGLFRELPSLEEYVLVSSFSHHVEIYHKHEENIWGITADASHLDQKVLIKSIELELSLEDIYYNTNIQDINFKFVR